VHKNRLRWYLNKKVLLYNRPDFIAADPIAIPHRFTKLQDIEIAGFFAAIFAWGQRITIINKCNELLQRMDNAPYDFAINHTPNDLIKLIGFKHRTFNDTDLLYTIAFFNTYYKKHHTLETAFTSGIKPTDTTIEGGLNAFRNLFFSLPYVPKRSYKHVASPQQNSACKRLCMMLRWYVRNDDAGVDFGIWKTIKPAQLVCPLDLHSGRIARQLGILKRQQNDWQAALELTENLKKLDASDPVKYDFALFGEGISNK
jgi:uncharacterized protein (TIGR02757 family)